MEWWAGRKAGVGSGRGRGGEKPRQMERSERGKEERKSMQTSKEGVLEEPEPHKMRNGLFRPRPPNTLTPPTAPPRCPQAQPLLFQALWQALMSSPKNATLGSTDRKSRAVEPTKPQTNRERKSYHQSSHDMASQNTGTKMAPKQQVDTWTKTCGPRWLNFDPYPYVV